MTGPLTVYLPICLSAGLSVYISIYLSACMSVRPSVRPPIHPSIRPSVLQPVCVSIYHCLPVCASNLSMYIFVCLLLHVHLCLGTSLFVCSSVSAFVCLSGWLVKIQSPLLNFWFVIFERYEVFAVRTSPSRLWAGVLAHETDTDHLQSNLSLCSSIKSHCYLRSVFARGFLVPGTRIVLDRRPFSLWYNHLKLYHLMFTILLSIENSEESESFW